ERLAVPVPPEKRVEVDLAEAVDRLDELALKRHAAHLAVGDDLQAGILLQAHSRVNRTVLDGLEGRRRQRPGSQLRTDLEQLCRTQQTANHTVVSRDHLSTSKNAVRSRPRGEAAAATTEPRARSSGSLLRACTECAPPSLGRDLAQAFPTLLRLRGGLRGALETRSGGGVGGRARGGDDRGRGDRREP